jgi:hypothetical protein
MTVETVIATLKSYEVELDGILSRFIKDREGIHIFRDDNVRVRGLVLELRDLFVDEFIDGHRHANPMIARKSPNLFDHLVGARENTIMRPPTVETNRKRRDFSVRRARPILRGYRVPMLPAGKVPRNQCCDVCCLLGIW